MQPLSDLGVRRENPILASPLADERHCIGPPVAWWQLYRRTAQPGFCCIIKVGLWSPQLVSAVTTHTYECANLYVSVELVKQMLSLCLRFFALRVISHSCCGDDICKWCCDFSSSMQRSLGTCLQQDRMWFGAVVVTALAEGKNDLIRCIVDRNVGKSRAALISALQSYQCLSCHLSDFTAACCMMHTAPLQLLLERFGM